MQSTPDTKLQSLWPQLTQSLDSQHAGDLVTNQTVGCYYCPPDLKITLPALLLWASIKLYCLVTEAHVRVNNLPTVNMWQQNGWKSNRWPFNY